MATSFPALHARMGDHDYYVAVCTVGEAARTIQYVEDVDGWTPESPPELKLQRKLNTVRVEREMVPYLLENSDHFYGALTVEVRPADLDPAAGPAVQFQSQMQFPGGIEFGLVTLDGTEVLYALDGQHRLKSLERALLQQPQIARDQIALIIIPFRDIKRSQSLFSDLNRYARAPSKSMSLLFTHREGLARIAKGVASQVELLDTRVNMESTTLSRNARHFITLSTLYEMTKSLLRDALDDPALHEEAAIVELAGIFETLSSAVPQWKMVAEGGEHPAYLRARYLNMHGVCQQAIAIATARARSECPESWQELVQERFGAIDWRLQNPRWQGIAMHGGRVNNTSTSIRHLAGLLEVELGFPPEACQMEVIATVFEQQGLTLPEAAAAFTNGRAVRQPAMAELDGGN